MYITIEQIKKHLNIDADFTEDDNYLINLEEVAEAIVEKHIDCTFSDIAKNGELPKPILQAILFMTANLYANRESVAYTNAIEIPFAYDYLLSLYKNYNN